MPSVWMMFIIYRPISIENLTMEERAELTKTAALLHGSIRRLFVRKRRFCRAVAFDRRTDEAIGHSVKCWNTKPQANCASRPRDSRANAQRSPPLSARTVYAVLLPRQINITRDVYQIVRGTFHRARLLSSTSMPGSRRLAPETSAFRAAQTCLSANSSTSNRLFLSTTSRLGRRDREST